MGLKLSAAPCCSCSAGRAVLAVAFPWSLCWFQSLQWNCVINFLSLFRILSQVKLQCVLRGWQFSREAECKRKGQQGSRCCTGEPLLCTHSGMLLWSAAEMFFAICKPNPVCFCSSGSCWCWRRGSHQLPALFLITPPKGSGILLPHRKPFKTLLFSLVHRALPFVSWFWLAP